MKALLKLHEGSIKALSTALLKLHQALLNKQDLLV